LIHSDPVLLAHPISSIKLGTVQVLQRGHNVTNSTSIPFCRQLGAALATAGAGILLTINLMAQTTLTIAPSPHNSVTISPVGDSKTFSKIFNAETNQFRDLHVVVENHSDRAIVAAVLMWQFTAVNGKLRRTSGPSLSNHY
jgi:hypothetical protein